MWNLVAKEPFAQFKAWFNEASHHERIGNNFTMFNLIPDYFLYRRVLS